MRYIAPITFESFTANPEDAMAKGQMRSNKEKKKPKQDKNKDERRRRPLAVRRHAQPDEPKPVRQEVLARTLQSCRRKTNARVLRTLWMNL